MDKLKASPIVGKILAIPLKLRIIGAAVFGLLIVVIVVLLAMGGGSKSPSVPQPPPNDYQPPWEDPGGYTPPDIGAGWDDPGDPVETPPPGDETPPENIPVDSGTYLDNDFNIGRPLSTKYEFGYVAPEDLPNIESEEVVVSGYTDVYPAPYYGFFIAVNGLGDNVVLSPDMEVVTFPSGEFTVYEPAYLDGKIFFRVSDAGTVWRAPRDENHNEWWLPHGQYAVVDAEGKEVVEFGKYDYIDAFVEGKARVRSVADKCDYIISADGKVLQEYPFDGKVSPYKLFPDGYLYMRTDVGRHAHFVTTWDGTVVISADEYYDDIFPRYLGDHVFAVYDGILVNKSLSGTRFYYGPDYVPPPPELRGVLYDSEGMIVIGRITNGLVGALAKWEHEVRDIDGNRLVAPGRYIFKSGWGGGYALAQVGRRTVLLDTDFKETEAPAGMEIVGRYANDADLFLVRVTQDFKLYRYPEVPKRYESPIGVVDGEFNWVIPPGELEYLRALPLQSVYEGAGYLSGNDDEGDNVVLVTRK